MKVVESLRIDRPPAKVWEVLADFGALDQWAGRVDHSSLVTTQRSGLGAVRRVQVGRITLLERIVEWEPRVRIGYDIEGLPIVRRLNFCEAEECYARRESR